MRDWFQKKWRGGHIFFGGGGLTNERPRKKLHSMAQTDTQTHKHGDSMTNSAQTQLIKIPHTGDKASLDRCG